MCPKRARHVFITDRLKNPHLPGPDNEAAALAMGNTVEQWFRTYYPQAAHDKVGWPPNCPALALPPLPCHSPINFHFQVTIPVSIPVPCALQMREAQQGMQLYRQHILQQQNQPIADPLVLLGHQHHEEQAGQPARQQQQQAMPPAATVIPDQQAVQQPVQQPVQQAVQAVVQQQAAHQVVKQALLHAIVAQLAKTPAPPGAPAQQAQAVPVAVPSRVPAPAELPAVHQTVPAAVPAAVPAPAVPQYETGSFGPHEPQQVQPAHPRGTKRPLGQIEPCPPPPPKQPKPEPEENSCGPQPPVDIVVLLSDSSVSDEYCTGQSSMSCCSEDDVSSAAAAGGAAQ